LQFAAPTGMSKREFVQPQTVEPDAYYRSTDRFEAARVPFTCRLQV